MPAGCDFICQNSQCEQNGNGFVITGPWPMGEIELVISSMTKSLVVKSNLKDVLDKVIDNKKNGRKYACIVFPNNDNIETVAYRVQLWSPEAKCVWDFDLEVKEEPDVAEMIKANNLPILCPKTSGPLLSFSEVTKNGIDCPYCGEQLQQSRWFSNE